MAPVAGPASEDSLDFSAYVPPPPSAPLPVPPAPAPAPQSAPQEADPAAPPLDVSALASSLAGQPGPAPGTEASAAIDDVATVIGETATLFAKGQVEQALARLLNSVREEDLGNSSQQAWLMLFDLYQHLDMREEFEALAPEFVVKFERSAPAWLETGERRDPALDTGGVAYFALGGMLTDASAPELERLRDAAAARRAGRG